MRDGAEGLETEGTRTGAENVLVGAEKLLDGETLRDGAEKLPPLAELPPLVAIASPAPDKSKIPTKPKPNIDLIFTTQQINAYYQTRGSKR